MLQNVQLLVLPCLLFNSRLSVQLYTLLMFVIIIQHWPDCTVVHFIHLYYYTLVWLYSCTLY